MSEQHSRFARLRDMAAESSSEGRRAILREVTDAFVDGSAGSATERVADLDAVLSGVIADFSREVRAELAGRIGRSGAPLAATSLTLALDDIAVARPMLEHSTALSDAHLLAVVAQKTQDHMLAISRRKTISEDVSHALAAQGDDRVVVALLENSGARIADRTYEAITEQAKERQALHRPLVRRDGVPPELLNEIYLEVESNLRREILARYQAVPPDILEAALARGRERLKKAGRATNLEVAKIKARLDDLRRRGTLAPPVLIGLLREGEGSRPLFYAAFAALADVDDTLVQRVATSGDIDALALLCRGAGFVRAIFVSLAIALVGSDSRMARVEEFGALYEQVPVSAAERAVRFWKVRAAAGG